MRKPMPLHWIEEAEARQVLATALGEAPPSVTEVSAPRWARVRRWFAAAPKRRSVRNPAAASMPENVTRIAARAPR